jgi:periplasmic protein TonB
MKMKTLILAMAVSLAAGVVANADVRVSSADGMKAATNKPSPAYSPIARQMKIAGHVEVEAVVGTDGNVEAVKAVTGNPILTQSAIQAVQKWKFTPFTANGEATKAVVTLAFDFKP